MPWRGDKELLARHGMEISALRDDLSVLRQKLESLEQRVERLEELWGAKDEP